MLGEENTSSSLRQIAKSEQETCLYTRTRNLKGRQFFNEHLLYQLFQTDKLLEGFCFIFIVKGSYFLQVNQNRKLMITSHSLLIRNLLLLTRTGLTEGKVISKLE